MSETPIRERSRIAVVDDDGGVRASVVAILERNFDVDVESFERGSDAIRRADEVPFALAILDLDMPELNGLDVARALRLAQPAVRIMFLTGSVGDFPAEDVAAVQPLLILNKPVTTTMLTNAVRQALGL